MKQYRVKPGCRLSLDQHDPDETVDYKKSDNCKSAAKDET